MGAIHEPSSRGGQWLRSVAVVVALLFFFQASGAAAFALRVGLHARIQTAMAQRVSAGPSGAATADSVRSSEVRRLRYDLAKIRKEIESGSGDLEGARAALARANEMAGGNETAALSQAAAGEEQAAALIAQIDAALAAPAPPVPTGPMDLPLRRMQPAGRAEPVGAEVASPMAEAGVVASASAPEDLADSDDARQCAEVVAQAAALGNDPVRMYEFVRNNIAYEPYPGLRKGSCETLSTMAGNSFDHASLLVAMLRASGIPARFAIGDVDLTAAQAAGLFGISDAALASSMIQTSGIPAVSLVDGGGQVVFVRMQRAWVRALVPYGNYRGVRNDDTGAVWVPLDPALKAFQIVPPIDLAATAGIDPVAFQAVLDGASTVDPVTGQVVGVDQAAIENEVTGFGATLNANLDSIFGVDMATNSDVFGSTLVTKQVLGALPASLPYTLSSAAVESAELADPQRYRLTIQVADASFTGPLSAINGKRLTATWPAAGVPGPPGTIYDVLPTIRLDGVVVATGTAIPIGSSVDVRLDYLVPNQSVDVVQNTREAGEVLAIVLDTGRMPRQLVDDALNAAQAAVDPTDRAEWGLTGLGRSYFAQLDQKIFATAALGDMLFLHEVFGAILTGSQNTELLFGVPVATEFAGANIDVDRQILTPFSKVGDQVAERRFLLSAGQNSSAMENAIFNQSMDLAAVSTARVIQLANASGVPVYRIDSSNAALIIPLLTHDASTIATINAEIAGGRVVTIPRDPTTHFDWTGTGYLTEDPASGAGGYIISGGLSGHTSTSAGGDIALNLPCISAVVQLIDLIPIPYVGALFDILAVPAGLYDIGRADVAPWRKTVASVFVYISLLGAIGAIPSPPTMLLGFLVDAISYAIVWGLLGFGNPLDPCFTRRREDTREDWLVDGEDSPLLVYA